MRITLFLLLALLCSCDDTTLPDPIQEAVTYFPPNDESNWESLSLEKLDWEADRLEALYTYLEANNTRAFLVLKDGKIVVEKYWGRNILNTADFDQESRWYWASAGKTLTAFLTGIAQEKDLLQIIDRSSDHLGRGWTNLPEAKEDLITIRHQLTMTTGLEYAVEDLDCTEPSCLKYSADAGTQWYYHNAPYTLISEVISNASNTTYNQFTEEQLANKIGMDGEWRKIGYNTVYWSTARDAARFGWLVLNKGQWNDTRLLSDQTYLEAMTNSSQTLNPAYGYLWWLNGKDRAILPSSPQSFQTAIAPDAPSDLFAALGKNGQFIDIVPSKNLVVVRMGQAPADDLVPIQLHNDLWAYLMEVIE